jgi:hypothetical protein
MTGVEFGKSFMIRSSVAILIMAASDATGDSCMPTANDRQSTT